jgi:tetratricopeptide (TPR) repeat protein
MRVSVAADERFQIDRCVGSGGMGVVYRAVDRRSGAPVALKIALDGDDQHRARASVEAEALASLDHPAIVRLIASGLGPDGRAYLAMEWLEGEDLAGRLARGPLSGKETAVLGARVAEGLASAHAAGVVHRDLKPSNLFLPGGEIAQVKLLDFGIARLGQRRLTRSGVLIGTPGYMAPEQATGEGQIGAAADLFALGAVLFECVAGRPAFTGQHPVAVLAKVLFEEAPSLADRCPGLPAAFTGLVARLLAKDPAVRPTAPAAAAALAELVTVLATAPRAEAPRFVPDASTPFLPTLSLLEEQRLVCVLVARPPAGEPAGAAEGHDLLERLRAVVAPLGGRAERLLDGALVASWTGDGVPRDLAAKAARAALLAREMLPGAALALGSGLAALPGGLRLGAALDRAAAALDAADGAPRAVLVDEVTAGLLDDRFQIHRTTAGHELVARHTLGEGEARQLLGRAAPCVGRERELRGLADLLDECIDAPRACAAMVTAPPGIGKSRLRHEMVRLVRLRGDVTIWSAEADELGAASPFALIGAALQSAAGIHAGDPPDARRRALADQVARRVPEADRPRVGALLGEIAGAHFPAAAHPLLAAARSDPRIMAEQVRRAFLELLAAECAARPLLLVLEDLHWADPPSLKLVAAVLTALRDRPFMVLGLARPEARDRCPELWAVREVQEIRLNGLTRRAASELVRRAMPAADDALVQRVVERADGNALYLEELLRAVAAGKGDDLPETIAAMVQARLGDLPIEERRALRAAAIFGGAFCASAVEALLGGGTAGALLDALVAREVIEPRPQSRFPGETELVFRHALLRDGAYALLTEGDRAAGHLRAAEWLERHALAHGDRPTTDEHAAAPAHDRGPRDRSDETGAARIARHFELGQAPARAAEWHARAAEHAMHVGDPSCSAASAERGLASLAALPEGSARDRLELGLQIACFRALSLTHGFNSGEARRALFRAQSLCPPGAHERAVLLTGLWQLHLTSGEPWTARPFAEELLDLAAVRSDRHGEMVARFSLGVTGMFLGEHRMTGEHLRAGLRLFVRGTGPNLVVPSLMGTDHEAQLLCYLSINQWAQGRIDQGLATLHRALSLADELAHPFTIAAVSSLAAIHHQHRCDRAAALEHAARAKAVAAEHGYLHYVLQSSILHGWARAVRGGPPGGVDEIEQAIAVRRARGAKLAMTHLLSLLAEAQLEAGRLAEALATLEEASAGMSRTGERLWASEVHRLTGVILWERGAPGDADRAEDHLLRALDIARCQGALTAELRATTSLARLWRAQGNGREGRERLERVLARFAEGFDTVDLKGAQALLREELSP